MTSAATASGEAFNINTSFPVSSALLHCVVTGVVLVELLVEAHSALIYSENDFTTYGFLAYNQQY